MYANGSRYVGQWEHNKKVGHGTFTFEDGSVYDGPFVDDRMAEGKVQQQVDIFACLDLKPYLASEAEPEMGARAVQNLLTRHNTEVKQIYRYYAALGVPSSEAFVLSLSQFWRFAHHCGLATAAMPIAALDRLVAGGGGDSGGGGGRGIAAGIAAEATPEEGGVKGMAADDDDDDAPLDRGALLRKVFAACDDDKSGYLSIAEFKQLAETNGDAQFAEFVFGTMDSAAADGRLSITEFVTNNLEPEMSDDDFAERTATWLKLAESRVVGAGDGGQSLPLPLLRLKAVVEGRADDTLGASATIAEAHRAERPLLLREFLQALVTIAAAQPPPPGPPGAASATLGAKLQALLTTHVLPNACPADADDGEFDGGAADADADGGALRATLSARLRCVYLYYANVSADAAPRYRRPKNDGTLTARELVTMLRDAKLFKGERFEMRGLLGTILPACYLGPLREAEAAEVEVAAPTSPEPGSPGSVEATLLATPRAPPLTAAERDALIEEKVAELLELELTVDEFEETLSKLSDYYGRPVTPWDPKAPEEEAAEEAPPPPADEAGGEAGGEAGEGEEAAAEPPAPPPLDREKLLRKVFASCDDDGSGALSVAEFAQLAASQSDIAMAMQEAVFAMVDANTDSTLSVDEFVKFNLANGEGLEDAEFAAQVAQWQALADARLVLKRGTNYLSFVEATLLPNLGAHLRSVLERLAGVETAAAPAEEEEEEY